MAALEASEQSADMLTDLKPTHLLPAAPRAQPCPVLWRRCLDTHECGYLRPVFSSLPCINDLSLQDKCLLPAPDVGAWRAVAVTVTVPALPITAS